MGLQETVKSSIERKFTPAVYAKGLEKIILVITLKLIDIYFAIQKIFYGSPIPRNKYIRNTKIPRNPLKLGVIPILRILAAVDFCNLLTYLAGRQNLGRFDPNNPPPSDAPPFLRSKWKLQKVAYDTQKEIDRYLGTFASGNNANSKAAIFLLISGLELKLSEEFRRAANPQGSTDVGGQGNLQEQVDFLNSEFAPLATAYPQLTVINQYLKEAFRFFRTYVDARQIDDSAFLQILTKIQRIRQLLILIQALQTPAQLLSFLANIKVLGPKFFETIKRIEKLIVPSRLIPFLKRLIDVLRNIQKICILILNFIKNAQLIITIVLIIIRVIRIIIAFLKGNPIPSMFITMGIQSTVDDGVQIIKDKGITKLEQRLLQVLLLLQVLEILIRSLLPILNEIIYNLSRIISSIRSCQNGVDERLLRDLEGIRDQLQDSADQLYIFLKNKELNDAASGTYDNTQVPIDQLLANPGDLDETGIAASLGIPPPPIANRGGKKGPGATSSPNTGSIGGGFNNLSDPGGSPEQVQKDKILSQLEGIPEAIEAINSKYDNNSAKQPGKNVTDPVGKIGEYTIQIITEEVVEQTFGLKRRYGVALNNRGEKVVQSMPTYASDSQVIIREVQQLLLSKNFVKANFSLFDPDLQNAMKDATNYLYNKNINWENFPGLSNRFRARLGIDANGKRIPVNGIVNNGQNTSFGGNSVNQNNKNIAVTNNPSIQGTNTGGSNLDNLGVGSTLEDGYFNDGLDLPVDSFGIPGVEEFQVNDFDSSGIPDIGGIDGIVLDEFDVDSPENENENDKLGLNAFINKLKGGKKLRRRMRKIFAKKLAKLKTDMQSEDPQRKFGGQVGDRVAEGTSKLAPETQSNNVDLNDGAAAFTGVVTTVEKVTTTQRNSAGELITTVTYRDVTVASIELRADDSELAKQKLIEKYDPNEQKGYTYTVNMI